MKKVLIIAEAGVNHNGNLKTAIELVHKAVEAQVDIVKFQTFKAKLLATADAKTADYQNKNLKSQDSSQLEMLKKLELSFEDHHVLKEECRKLGTGFLSTAFDFESLDFLMSLNLGLWKIPSGEITNLPYLEKIGKLNQPTIVSTGMCDLSEVDAALRVLRTSGLSDSNLTVLHCNTDYPTQMSDVNLRAMQAMGKEFGIAYGYSDHTLGIEIPTAAVALGATVIEKHFTLDRNMTGPDHAASLEPNELKAMVKAIRHVEQALGSSIKAPSLRESANKAVARKSIVAATEINAGEMLTVHNMTTSRPGTGISPMKWHDVLGKSAQKNYKAGDLI
ncbi:MAG: N-acetylneuraminate synthase [Bdellovibrio sp.]|nr:N-acetylneuraminate synthase [Bdellovibrio sp.]